MCLQVVRKCVQEEQSSSHGSRNPPVVHVRPRGLNLMVQMVVLEVIYKFTSA